METGKKRTGSELDILVNDFLGIDDILDFSNDDIGGPIQSSCSTFINHLQSSFSSSSSSSCSCSSSASALEERKQHEQREDVSYDHHLCLPYCDEIAELEWLSMFVEESFSTQAGDTQFLPPHNDILPPQNNNNYTASTERRMKEEKKEEEENMRLKESEAILFHSRSPKSVLEMGNSSSSSSSSSSTSGCVKEKAVPGRARSKRPRGSVTNKGVAGWNILSSRRILLNSTSSCYSDYSAILAPAHKPNNVAVPVEVGAISRSSTSDESRRCLHCGSQKTPQWRAGPLGPKTLCNACGVRFKSGRLLPEYRPASSPTFVDTIHSNSHKKVLEMRRTKEGIIPCAHYNNNNNSNNSTPHRVMKGFCRDEEWTQLLSHK